MPSTQAALSALLSSLSIAIADGDELERTVAAAFHNRKGDGDDGRDCIPQFALGRMMRTPHHRLLEKRRSVDSDVGVLSRSACSAPKEVCVGGRCVVSSPIRVLEEVPAVSPVPTNSSTPTPAGIAPGTPTSTTFDSDAALSSESPVGSGPVIDSSDPRPDVVVTASVGGSSSLSMGSIDAENLVDQCTSNCPDSLLCKCLGNDATYECYYSPEFLKSFCEDTACLPENEAALFNAYMCPTQKCVAGIGIQEMMAHARDAYENGNKTAYDDEQLIQASATMKACTYCVGRKSLCGTCREDESFCNTVFETTTDCEGNNCTTKTKSVGDICGSPTMYFYGQFIDCKDYPELNVDNYASAGGGSNPPASPSNRAALGNAAVLALISVGLSQ